MRRFFQVTGFLLVLFQLLSCSTKSNEASAPEALYSSAADLKISSQNPHYFEYQGEPLILITSAEHYGAVLNGDFDFDTYLLALSEAGLNYTRIFTGTYLEPENNVFGIQRNTLAPKNGAYFSPFLMQEGSYDLSQYDPEYFKRLHAFMSRAEELGVIVEVTLFSSIYSETSWKLMPFYPDNNVNGTALRDYRRVHTLYNGDLLAIQEAFVRKMVRELNPYGNFFFEIQNEPWSDNSNAAAYVHEGDSLVFARSWQKKVELANRLAMDWQAHMAALIRETEALLPHRHVVAQNISNFQYPVRELPEGISLLNYHYADPEAFLDNRELAVPVGLDETGFMPHVDSLYIHQAWRSILSGAALYNNLDYSFTVGHEQGDWEIAASNPGWGGPVFRKKLARLSAMVHELPFTSMHPDTGLLSCEEKQMLHCALVREDGTILAFVEKHAGTKLGLPLPEGSYQLLLMDPDTEEQLQAQKEVKDLLEIIPPFGKKAFVIQILPL